MKKNGQIAFIKCQKKYFLSIDCLFGEKKEYYFRVCEGARERERLCVCGEILKFRVGVSVGMNQREIVCE